MSDSKTYCEHNVEPFDCQLCMESAPLNKDEIIARQDEIIEDLRRQLGLPETPEAALLKALTETQTTWKALRIS